MNWVRKTSVYLLSLFLLATLISTAVFTSTNNTFSKPAKIETYLSDSQIYNHFISYITDQAKKTIGDADQSNTVSLNDATIQSAAEAAFTKESVQQSINTFIDSNYAWLEGKSPTPNFRIDLTAQKNAFAQQVGEYAKTYTASLPVCPAGVQPSQSLLSATCRPAALTPEAAQAQITGQLTSSGSYLSNPVITPTNLNPDSGAANQPYYQKLSRLPDVYQVSLKLPYILAALSLLFAVGIIFISRERRKGVRLVGIMLLIAGTSLVIVKFTADAMFRAIDKRVFTGHTVGQLQQSLTDFSHRIETSVVRTELWFGIGFLLLAAVIFAVLTGTRKHAPSSPSDGASGLPDVPHDESDDSVLNLSPKRLKPPLTGIPTGPKLGGEPPAPGAPAPHTPPRPKKKPRLIQ